MKKLELLGLSVVAAAALIMTTGCSSDDSSSSASAPAEITAAVDINYTTVKNAIYMARSIANNKLPAPMLAPETGSGQDGSTETYDCDVSGSYTYTWASTWDGVYDAQHSDGYGLSWSWTTVETTTYDNCVDLDNTSTAYPLYLPTTHRIRTGSHSEAHTNSYNVDTNTSYQQNVFSDHYSDSYEDNASSASRTETYSMDRTRTSTWQGDVYRDAEVSGATYHFDEIRNGFEQREDTNTTGAVYYGWKTVKGNEHTVQEGTYDVVAKYTANGFSSSYDINASGEWELDGGKSFSNFVITSTANGADEDKISISGKVGSACIGGSVTFATAPVMQQDQVNYFNTYSTNGYYTLPHTGVVTVSGAGTATVTFDSNESNYTSAVISGIDDVNETASSWNDLAVQDCVN